MTWQGIEGHDPVVEQFRRALRRGRLASTFLFIGPAGIGKRALALKLAQGLLCERAREVELAPCGGCSACQQVEARTHPDLLLISKPPEASFIPLRLFIGDDDQRLREGLCHDIALKPFRGGRKIAVIDDADFFNQEGANCLLKTLEEPPPKSVIILIGTSEQKQLPTIRSRSQIVRFQPLSQETVAQLLLTKNFVQEPQAAARLAALSEGSVQRAEIPLPSTTWRIEPSEPRLGIVKVNLVAASSADEISKAMADLQQRGATHFVLDLRDNPGGLLTAGVDIARLFLKDGIVMQQQYRGREVEDYRVEKPGPFTDIPLVVLINQGSASAAEIAAGALQATGRAPLIGTRSYGKDSIQLLFTLQDGSSLHVTAARWWVPGLGGLIKGQGLQPDQPVDPATAAANVDPYLQAALQHFFKTK